MLHQNVIFVGVQIAKFSVGPRQMILNYRIVELPDLETLVHVEGQKLPAGLRPADGEYLRVLRVDVEKEGQLDALGRIPQPHREILTAGQHLGRLVQQEGRLSRSELDAIDLFEVAVEPD